MKTRALTIFGLFFMIGTIAMRAHAQSEEAALCFQQQDYNCAEKLYRKMLRKEPHDFAVRFNLANALWANHKNREALLLFQELIRNAPNIVVLASLKQVTELYLEAKQLPMAFKSIRHGYEHSVSKKHRDTFFQLERKALELSNDQTSLRILKLWDQYSQFSPADICKELEQYHFEVEPAHAYGLHAMCLMDSQQYEQSQNLLESIQKWDPAWSELQDRLQLQDKKTTRDSTSVLPIHAKVDVGYDSNASLTNSAASGNEPHTFVMSGNLRAHTWIDFGIQGRLLANRSAYGFLDPYLAWSLEKPKYSIESQLELWWWEKTWLLARGTGKWTYHSIIGSWQAKISIEKGIADSLGSGGSISFLYFKSIDLGGPWVLIPNLWYTLDEFHEIPVGNEIFPRSRHGTGILAEFIMSKPKWSVSITPALKYDHYRKNTVFTADGLLFTFRRKDFNFSLSTEARYRFTPDCSMGVAAQYTINRSQQNRDPYNKNFNQLTLLALTEIHL